LLPLTATCLHYYAPGYQPQLLLQRLRQGVEEFGLALLALMARHANVIKQPVQLSDDAVELLLEEAGVHGWQYPATAVATGPKLMRSLAQWM